MCIPCFQGAQALTESAAASCPLPPANIPPNSEYEPVRHMLFGSLSAVRSTIHVLHKLNYAEPNDWSQPISTGRSNEVMAILTKRVSLR
ncbi:MAG: hypothetical protein WBC73_14640 [Phormidesmis sp.]